MGGMAVKIYSDDRIFTSTGCSELLGYAACSLEDGGQTIDEPSFGGGGVHRGVWGLNFDCSERGEKMDR